MGTSYFGFKCPRCGSTVGVGIVPTNEEPKCPSCGTEMEPNPEAQGAAANVYCPACSIAVGLVTSDRCPQCGGPWSALPG